MRHLCVSESVRPHHHVRLCLCRCVRCCCCCCRMAGHDDFTVKEVEVSVVLDVKEEVAK